MEFALISSSSTYTNCPVCYDCAVICARYFYQGALVAVAAMTVVAAITACVIVKKK
jgi:hypothetical protein